LELNASAYIFPDIFPDAFATTKPKCLFFALTNIANSPNLSDTFDVAPLLSRKWGCPFNHLDFCKKCEGFNRENYGKYFAASM